MKKKQNLTQPLLIISFLINIAYTFTAIKDRMYPPLGTILNKHRLFLARVNGGERAYLLDANLRYANLQGANLRSANLYGANLRSANLRYANLQDADLRGANLQDANLWGANILGANLRGALFDEDLLKKAITK